MKYCTHCGKELFDDAVICVGCGCAAHGGKNTTNTRVDYNTLLNTLSSRFQTSGIIWIVIGGLQILIGFFVDWVVFIIGILNIVSAVKDIKYSKSVLEKPTGIVQNEQSLTGPIITLVYNLIVGGFIGVVGSIYYFIAIRGFVMENKAAFEMIESINADKS